MARRWEDLIAEGEALKVMEDRVQSEYGNIRWQWGDLALEVARVGRAGAHSNAEERLRKFADELDSEYETLRVYRYVADRWPPDMRVSGEQWSVHQLFAGRDDREELISGPVDVRTGEKLERWTFRAAQRFLGNKPSPGYRKPPQTPAEKVAMIEDLLDDPDVAELFDSEKKAREPKVIKSFDDRCASWVHRANKVLMDGSRLAAEAEHETVGPHAELALSIHSRLTERQLDIEIRNLLDASEAER